MTPSFFSSPVIRPSVRFAWHVALAAALGVPAGTVEAGSPLTAAATAVPSAPATPTEITGTLDVIQVCYLAENKGDRWYDLIEDQTGQRFRLKFETELTAGHLTGERVRVRGILQEAVIRVPAVKAGAGLEMEVLAVAPPQTNNLTQPFSPKSLYGGGVTSNTVVHQTLVMLLNYTNSAPHNASSITTFSNKFFAPTGSSVNTAYLENTYGAVGFAGKVIVCNIASDATVCNTGDWKSKADAQATAQGETLGSYRHRVYIVPCCPCGWAGLASVGGNWSMDAYTDGGTICHELGHNLGFAHAASDWGDTGSTSEYGDTSDFMGASYNWRHNNAPHKLQLGWLTAQTVAQAGSYQIGPIEHVPGTIPFPQVLKVSASSPPTGWPYYFSYKQSIGFDANVGATYNKGVNIHRWGGGGSRPSVVAVVSDGGT
jgi:hypothetical protein